MSHFRNPFAGLMVVSALLLCTGCLPPPEAAENEQPQVDDRPMELVPAAPGVAKQGRIIGDGGGPLTTPAAAYFKTKQKIVFEIQIGQAMQLYQAEHEHPPKSHEEFMEKIIDFNRIPLPELPEGHEYIYDPEQGQLMVRRPVGE